MTKKYFTRLLQASLMCCLAVLFTACDDMFATEDNPTSAYLGMSEKPVTIKVGETFQRQATTTSTAVIEYTSSDTKIATVDNTGLVTAIAEGETTITATVTGYSSQTGKKIYLPDSKSYQLTVKPATLPAATITTAPVATTGDILAGSTTALVVAGVADGGTMMYRVTPANEAKPTSTEGFSADIPSASNRADGTYSVWYYAKGDAQHSDSEIAATAVEVTIKPSKATPLTLKAITAGTIVVKNPQAGMKYSLNGGAKQAVTTDAITVAVGDKVQFYGNGTSITAYYSNDYIDNDTKITGGTAEVKVYGNIMSLVDETGFATNTTLTAENTFAYLFNGNAQLTDISDLQMPATTLAEACYYNMFNGCTGLTTVPEKLLPATTLKNRCYQNLFQGCTGLTTVPEKLLPATEMKTSCYASMFYQCTGLTTVPEKLLPAEALALNCYLSMFNGCTSLTTAPKLPATTLAQGCYQSMFRDCASLTTAPKLPATTLAQECYLSMFNGCTSLTTAYVKAAYKTSYNECEWMFKGCTATGAKLHTTSTNKDGWIIAISNNSWSTWTAVGDWTD